MMIIKIKKFHKEHLLKKQLKIIKYYLILYKQLMYKNVN